MKEGNEERGWKDLGKGRKEEGDGRDKMVKERKRLRKEDEEGRRRKETEKGRLSKGESVENVASELEGNGRTGVARRETEERWSGKKGKGVKRWTKGRKGLK